MSARKQLPSVWAVLSFVACLTAVTFILDGTRNPNIVGARVVGIVVTGVLAFLLLRLSRAGRASWRFELTDRDLLLPPPGLYLRRHVRVPFDQILGLRRDASGAVDILHQKGVGVLPADCFPKGWDARYVTGRIAVRWKLWCDGHRLTADQLAAIEAQLDHVDENGQPAIATMLMPAAEGRGPVVMATFGADGSERGPFPPPSSGGPSREGDDQD